MSARQQIKEALLERDMTAKELANHTGIGISKIFPVLSRMINIKRIKHGTNPYIYSLEINKDLVIDGAAYGRLSSVKLTSAKWRHGAGR